MKILFTKILDPVKITEKLGKDYSFDCCKVISIKPLPVEPFDISGKSLIFSSVNAVDCFFNDHFSPSEDVLSLKFNKIYAVGQLTKKRIRKYGFGTFKVTKDAQELLEFIITNSQREKFLHFCGNLSLDLLSRRLPLQNISYKKVILYETELLYPKIRGNYDTVCFFSPSGVRSFAQLNSLEGIRIISIGDTTTEELVKHTDNKPITSSKKNLDDMLSIIKKLES